MHLVAVLLSAFIAASPARIPADDSLMAPGVSKALADVRKANIRSVRYDLALDVTALDTARGRITIRFSLRHALAAAGATVAVSSRKAPAFEAATAEIVAAGQKALGIPANAGRPTRLQRSSTARSRNLAASTSLSTMPQSIRSTVRSSRRQARCSTRFFP